MHDVFISYAREDAALAERVASAIESAGMSVWSDRRLAVGSVFAREIEDALRAARVVVVLWTEHSSVSHWVQDEAGVARDAGKLVPIRIGAASPPLGFRQVHSEQFPADGDAAMADAIAGLPAILAAKIGGAAELGSFPLSPRKRPTRNRARGFTIAGAALAALAAGAVAVERLSHDGSRAHGDTLAVAVAPAPDAARTDTLTRVFQDNFRASLARQPWTGVVRADATGDKKFDYRIETSVDGNTDAVRIALEVHAPGAAMSDPVIIDIPASRLGDADLGRQAAEIVWRKLYQREAERVRGRKLDRLHPRELLSLSLSSVYAPWTERGVEGSLDVLNFAAARFPDNPDVAATLAQAHYSLGLIRRAGAEEHFKAGAGALARAQALAPASRWVTLVSADINFSTGRYAEAEEAFRRLIDADGGLPGMVARAADAKARRDGDFAKAEKIASAESASALPGLQKSQALSSAAYASMALGKKSASEFARQAVSAYPNNPDALMASLAAAALDGDDSDVRVAAARLCGLYPSVAESAVSRSIAYRKTMIGDGGSGWTKAVDRMIAAMTSREAIITQACKSL